MYKYTVYTSERGWRGVGMKQNNEINRETLEVKISKRRNFKAKSTIKYEKEYANDIKENSLIINIALNTDVTNDILQLKLDTNTHNIYYVFVYTIYHPYMKYKRKNLYDCTRVHILSLSP